ncbi:MAG: hypothetical protein QXI11_07665 [Thermoproteota archaeon]
MLCERLTKAENEDIGKLVVGGLLLLEKELKLWVRLMAFLSLAKVEGMSEDEKYSALELLAYCSLIPDVCLWVLETIHNHADKLDKTSMNVLISLM